MIRVVLEQLYSIQCWRGVLPTELHLAKVFNLKFKIQTKSESNNFGECNFKPTGSTTPSATTTTPTLTTTTAATTTTPAPFVCTQDGNFAIPGQCSSNYYICIDGIRYNGVCLLQFKVKRIKINSFLKLQMCPGLTIFDPVTSICTSPDTVSCLGSR